MTTVPVKFYTKIQSLRSVVNSIEFNLGKYRNKLIVLHV